MEIKNFNNRICIEIDADSIIKYATHSSVFDNYEEVIVHDKEKFLNDIITQLKKTINIESLIEDSMKFFNIQKDYLENIIDIFEEDD